MSLPLRLFLGVLLLLPFAGGCALHPKETVNPDRELLAAVDRSVTAAGCFNAAYHRVTDYPFLRTTRFWSRFAAEDLSPEAYAFWLNRLRELDREARSAELACLPARDIAGLEMSAGLPPGTLKQGIESSATALLAETVADRSRRPTPAEVRVPDDYRTWRRLIGLYPLVRIPISLAVANAYAERRAWFRLPLDNWLAMGTWRRLAAADRTGLSSDEVSALLDRASENPLLVPLPGAEVARRLAENFAPVIVQQIDGLADGWGAVQLTADGVRVDAARPTVYWYLDHLPLNDRSLLRINYVIWYPLRDSGNTPWFERGEFDGVTLGLVLAADGRPLLLETMNNCGCYHQFFPASGFAPPRPFPFAPDPLVPQTLPEAGPDERIAVYLNAGWHQVVRLGLLPGADAPGGYRLVSYRDLESLPGPSGRRRSFFDGNGVVPGSERVERFLFFSVGIPMVGSMRQRGHLPITLIGREHFDDPDLLQHNFQVE